MANKKSWSYVSTRGKKKYCRNDLTHPQNFYKLFAFIHLPPSFVPPRNLTSTMMGSQFIKPCSTKNGVQFDDPTCWTYVSSLSPLRAYLEQRFRFLNPIYATMHLSLFYKGLKDLDCSLITINFSWNIAELFLPIDYLENFGLLGLKSCGSFWDCLACCRK